MKTSKPGYLKPDFRLPTHRQYALEAGKITIKVGETSIECTLDCDRFGGGVEITFAFDERGRCIRLKPSLKEYVERLLECGEYDARRTFERGGHNTILLDVVELAW